MPPRKPEPDPALGELVRRVRDEQRLSREDVAFKARVAVSTVRRMEAGQGEPGWMNVRKVASALGLSLADIGAAVEQEGSGQERQR